MNRWNKTEWIMKENKKIDKFLKELDKLCKKHNLSISHEDGHGAFIIENYNKYFTDWMSHAHDMTK
jgi:hypothetical protein